MDSEEVLKHHAAKLRKELEAKPLLIEIRDIFSPSTIQEIERTIDRDGNIVATDMILTKLPMRDNWVEVFYKALNGKVINKPRLAKLFEQFIKEDSNTEEQSYSLETCLKDIPYFQTLKNLHPNDPPTWQYYTKKNGLHSEATLGDLMDNIFVKDKNVYEQIKKDARIKHTLIRQATRDAEPTNEESLLLTGETVSTDFATKVSTPTSDAKVSPPATSSKCSPVVPDTKNVTLSSGSLDFQQSYLPPLREIVCLQEKAWENMALNQAQENTTKSVPTTFVPPLPVTVDRDWTTSLPTMPAPERKKKILQVDESEVPQVNESEREVPQVDEREVPQVDEREVPQVDEREVPQVDESEREVPQIDEAREQNNSSLSSEASSPAESKREKTSALLHLSVLVLAMALSFSFGYYCSRR